ncbi:MAG: hypothetical protein ABSC01_03715 [Verrucomicrobiota bacterium]|jgi:hypothetical protein
MGNERGRPTFQRDLAQLIMLESRLKVVSHENKIGMSGGMEKLKQWLSHPLNLLLSAIASFASILSVFLYFHSIESRDLTFLVNPVKTAVVKSGEASRLKVSHDGQEIGGDITAVQIAFWNAGTLPIKKDEILEPIIISLGTNHAILESTLRKTTRQLTHISLDESQLTNGEVRISWDILEYLDGGVLQLIYAGDTSVSIQIHGTIEGQGPVQLRVFHGKISTPEEQYVERTKVDKTVLWLGSLVLLFSSVGFFLARKDKIERIFIALVIIAALTLILAEIWKYKTSTSLFDF